jgi:hypothetical protein
MSGRHGWGPGLRVSDCRDHTSSATYLVVLANDLQRIRAGARINL